MASTGNVLTDIAVIYLPLALPVIMGILGLFRGVRREALVSFAIVLAALIISVWGTAWSLDIHDTFTGLGQQDTQTWLGVIVVVLISLVIGYGLGSALTPRGPMTAMSRLGGLLIGLGNGAALGGWILRNYYNSLVTDLSGSNATVFATLQDNIVTRSLIIWAGWFPLVVAVVAAIVALTGPFRRAQTVVATPSAQSNWAPATAPAAATTSAAATSYTPQYMQNTQPYPQQQYGQQPQAQPQATQYGQKYPPQFAVPAQQQGGGYAASGYSPPAQSSSQATMRTPDAPPTMPMPTSDATRPTAVGGQETVYFGGAAGQGSSPSAATSSPSTSSGTSGMGTTGSAKASAPNTGPLGELPSEVDGASKSTSTPSWAQPPDSSWLSAPQTPSVDSSAVSRSEAPTAAYPVSSGGSTSAASGALGTVTCSRCGASNPGDAMYCTECGNRLKS